MLRQNKWKILLTTLIILIPILVGCILWNRLPDTIATSFGVDSAANGWNSKLFAVLGIPAMIAVVHLFCLVVMSADPKQKNIGKKPLGIFFWILPCTSLLISTVIYGNAMDVKMDVGFLVCLFLGVLFVMMGNILPKAGQNYSFGIKLPWTLNDSENWKHTNRFGGWCMVIAGIVIIVTSLWHTPWFFFGVVFAAAAAPMFYSYIYEKRHGREK